MHLGWDRNQVHGLQKGCDRWTGGDRKPTETGTTKGDLEKFAESLEMRLGRMEEILDKIGL